MRIRRLFSYANVTATLALIFSLAGGAYAIEKIGSHDVANNSLRSVDLKNRRALKAKDVKINDLTGRQIDERTLDAEGFVPVTGNESVDCDPSSVALINCVSTVLPLHERSRILAIATGGEESVGGSATARCEVRIDNAPAPVGANPGEEGTDNTSGAATNGFARTLVTADTLPPGRHQVSLACNQLSGDVRIDAPTLAAIAIGSR